MNERFARGGAIRQEACSIHLGEEKLTEDTKLGEEKLTEDTKYRYPETINRLLSRLNHIKIDINQQTVFNPFAHDDNVRECASRPNSEFREMLAAVDTQRARGYGLVCEHILQNLGHLIMALEASDYSIPANCMDDLVKLHRQTSEMRRYYETMTFKVDGWWDEFDKDPVKWQAKE